MSKYIIFKRQRWRGTIKNWRGFRLRNDPVNNEDHLIHLSGYNELPYSSQTIWMRCRLTSTQVFYQIIFLPSHETVKKTI